MTSLVLGVVVGALGQMVGIPFAVGFMVGSLIGTLVDPPKSEGPRLSDLKLQRSTYGSMIPFVWGTGRLAGNCIDQTDLIEHKQQSGGKGGPQITSYTYSASFDLLLCATPVFGQPAILGVTRIWADGRLLWSVTTGGAMPCTLYTGTETQLPDPTFEAVHGVGSVPAYRGFAHAVFADYYLTDFGNRIPQMEFEVYTGAGAIPIRINTFSPARVGACESASITNGITSVSRYLAVSGSNFSDYEVKRYNLDGSFLDQPVNIIQGVLNPLGTYGVVFVGCANDPRYAVGVEQGSGPSAVSSWYFSGTRVNYAAIAPIYGATAGEDYYSITVAPFYYNGYIYGLGNPGGSTPYVGRWPVNPNTGDPDNVPDAANYTFSLVPAWGSGLNITVDDSGNVWVGGDVFGVNKQLYKFDADLNLIHTWALNTLPAGWLGAPFTVYNNQLAFIGVDPITGGTGVLVYSIDGYTGFTRVGVPLAAAGGPLIYLGNGLCLSRNGIISLIPPPAVVKLYTIVGNLSDMTPALGAYDVSELTDDVRWFAVASNMTVRNAIAVLRPIFFFDAVESDDIVKFRKRGSTSIATIPDKDLCARGYGEDSGDPLRTIRTKEQGLPRTVTLTYIDVNADYQTGAQSSRRQTTLSQSDVTLEIPVGLTSGEAAQKCWSIQSAEWIEREKFEWGLTRKWAYIEPCDVVVVRGREIRILTRTEMPNGVIKFTGVLSAPSIYTQSAPGAPGGFIPQLPPGARVSTQMLLLDIPMLIDSDYSRGYRVAMGPSADGSWPGAEAFKSSDGGTTYNSVAVAVAPDVIGVCSSTLGNFGGGYTFDETNVLTVVLTDDDATLTNYSEDAVLNGAGVYMVGLEIIQAKNAALTGIKTGELSGLLRGRRGTEWAIATHGANERFVALPITDVDMTAGELFQLRLYKAVTFGQTLAGATAQSFANMGAAARCYSPVDVGGGIDASGNLTINWKRRTRIGGDWVGLADVVLGEAVEKYEVQIWDATYTNVARIIETLTPMASYSAADQVTDFGVVQQEVYISVGQVGAYQLGVQTRATIPGGGVSINAVIAPIPPYNTPPIPGGGGGGTVNSVMAWPFQQDTTSGYKIGDTWVAQFTTGASGPISGHIDASEFADPAYARKSWLATDAAGLGVIAGTTQYGNSTSVIFSPSNVTTSTTYYFIVKTELSNGSPSGPLGSPAQMHITLVGAP